MRAVVAIIFLPILALAQGIKPFDQEGSQNLYVLTNLYSNCEGKSSAAANDLLDFARKLADKKANFKSEKAFLRNVFVKTHSRFLKHFTPYASFGQIFTDGNYNCLTGTSVYALLLDYLNVDFKIIETNYHIFLLASTSEGEILFEATDPVRGFEDNPRAVTKRINSYKENIPKQAQNNKYYYQYNFELFNEVSLYELSGLMHYNIAVVAYNNQDLEKAIHHLNEAVLLYRSPRIEDLSKIIMLSVVESSMEASVKEEYIRKIQSIRKKKFPALAQR